MSPKPPCLVSSQPSAIPSQKSPPKGFAPLGGRGRGRPLRGRIVLPEPPERDAMLVWWSALLMRHCGSAHEISRLFDVTEQTGRNWLDGVSCPTGLAVLHAMLLWPGEFAALVEDVDGVAMVRGL